MMQTQATFFLPSTRQMELYASGFNAWGQLYFDGHSEHDQRDDDLCGFACAFRDGNIEHVQSSLSHTIVRSKSSSNIAGYFRRDHQALHEHDAQAYSTLAEASNGSVAIIDTSGAVCHFTSVRDATSGTRRQCCPELPTCTQVVAYDTGFAALTTAGSVYTWGDERYGSCLGRSVSEDNPADKPGLVTALESLPTGPISKIAAGGYMLAALTAGNDLYLWGGRPGRKTIPADVADEPEPFVIDEQDIADVAVGESHLIVLTTEGRVFVVGENKNGQLGLPVDSADSWSPVELGLQDNRTVVGVAAGPRSSFIIVKEAL